MDDNNNGKWLIGRKDITKYCGVSWRTIQRWRKICPNFPIYKTPGKKPMAVKADLDKFIAQVKFEE